MQLPLDLEYPQQECDDLGVQQDGLEAIEGYEFVESCVESQRQKEN